MENAKLLSSPLPTYVKLSKCDCTTSDEDKDFMSKVPYQSAVGSLMYAMVATKLDIAFAVGAVSQFMSNLGKKHWDAVKLILRYLSGSARIFLGKGDASIIGYTDSDYAGCAGVGNLLQDTSFRLSEESLLGDLVFKNVLHCQLQKQSMLQLVWHVRKQYGFLD